MIRLSSLNIESAIFQIVDVLLVLQFEKNETPSLYQTSLNKNMYLMSTNTNLLATCTVQLIVASHSQLLSLRRQKQGDISQNDSTWRQNRFFFKVMQLHIINGS